MLKLSNAQTRKPLLHNICKDIIYLPIEIQLDTGKEESVMVLKSEFC